MVVVKQIFWQDGNAIFAQIGHERPLISTSALEQRWRRRVAVATFRISDDEPIIRKDNNVEEFLL